MANADGVIDDARDDGIPIATGAIVENTVAADEKVVAVALREAGGEVHRGAASARAGAISDIGLAHHGEGIRGVDAHAEFGAPAVEEQSAGLENSPTVARVKIGEVDEIMEERTQVAMVAGETLDAGDGGKLRGQAEIFGEERGEGVPAFAGENFLGASETEFFAGGAGFGGGPRVVRREPRLQVGPFGGGEGGLGRAKNRRDGGGVQRGEGG